MSAWSLISSTAGLLGTGSLAVALFQQTELDATRVKLERAERRVETLESAASRGSEGACFDSPAAAAPPLAAGTVRAEPIAEGVATPGSNEREMELPDEEPRSDAEVLFEYEQAFLSQVPDRDFQLLEETRLGRAIARLLGRADRSDGVTCRASMCRTRLSLADEEHYRAFMHRFGESAPPWFGETVLRREPDAGAGVTLWLYYTASRHSDGAS
jgi:hypothetical protein